MLSVPNQLVGAPLGTSVTLECNSESHPPAINYWMKNNIMIMHGEKYRTEDIRDKYRTYMKLSISDIQPRDYGKYQCISKNSLGETEGTIKLYGKKSSHWQ